MFYAFYAQGCEEIEAVTSVDVLRRAGISVKTLGIGAKTVFGSHGIGIVCDEIADLRFINDIDGIILPGGMPGTLNLEASPIVSSAIDYCVKHNKFICAICAAPSILGHRGLLKDKIATCYPDSENASFGARLTDDQVARDGNIITGKGPGASIEFALKIVESVKGAEAARRIRVSMKCQ
ncbi:MAG: DJ-1/PfpI family protein [Clostridiales bacterium]|jgi:4-methyl-5(b-hydroxyethyl)-thiazole monophosphate biosynthesis|nr:DJ-1/PfpI family protein [Clostridiales bacterium]